MEEQWRSECLLLRQLRNKLGEQESRALDVDRALRIKCEAEEQVEQNYAHYYEVERKRAGLLADEMAEFLEAKAASPITPHVVHPMDPLGSGLRLDGFSRVAREAETIKIPKHIPEVHDFGRWKMTLFTAVTAASGRGESAWAWINEVDAAGVTMESLSHVDEEWASLDSKLLAALLEVFTSGPIERELSRGDLGGGRKQDNVQRETSVADNQQTL